MNRFYLTAILLPTVLGLIACTNTNNTRTFVPAVADTGQAVVYIYRPSAMSNAIYSPALYINNENKLAIKNGQYVRLNLAAGEYTLNLAPEKNYAGITTLSLTLAAGEIQFIRVDTSLKIQSASNYAPYKRSFTLLKVGQRLAIKEISRCCTDSSNVSEVKQMPVNKSSKKGFSVDKTQNPFSH